MSHDTPTYSEENYIKAIYKLSLDGSEKISPTTIAEELGNNPASVIDMLKKLTDKKLIRYEKSKGVKLTDKGLKTALALVRNHRLWEVFLLEKLGYSWGEVHAIAEHLEHIHHPELADKLDKFLDFPQYDPHGDPIPKANGQIPALPSTTLDGVLPGKTCRVVAVKDTSPAFLTYLEKLNIRIGAHIKVLDKIDYDSSTSIQVDKNKATVSEKFTRNIVVDSIK
jgi:DtxR family Mn-dependent transcriptional regulator